MRTRRKTKIKQRRRNKAILTILIIGAGLAWLSTHASEPITVPELKREIKIEYIEISKKEEPKEETKEIPQKEKTVKEIIKEVFGENWEIAYAVAKAENRQLDPSAIGYNKDARKTLDRGIFQINSYWHAEVSDVCAYDARCNVVQAFRISKNGTDWHPWYTYQNKLHLKYLEN